MYKYLVFALLEILQNSKVRKGPVKLIKLGFFENTLKYHRSGNFCMPKLKCSFYDMNISLKKKILQRENACLAYNL